MSRRSPIFVLSLFVCNVAAHAAWVPVDCKDRLAEVRTLHKEFGTADIETAWQNHAAAVRRAKPGSPLYAPHPFPKTAADIVANFKYVYFEKLFDGTPWEKLPAREQPVYKALRENRLRIEIVRVENWGLSRCGRVHAVPYFYLLRFFDQAGKEVARSTEHVTGHMGVYHSLSGPASPLPPLNEVDGLLRSQFGRALHAEDVQYVSVGGLPYCSDHTPCVAFKSAGTLYLIDDGRLLYEIEPTAPRKSVRALRDERGAAGLAGLSRLGPEFDTPLVTLGFEWARARLIGGQKPE